MDMDIRDKAKLFLTGHLLKKRELAEKIGCTETHLRRFLNDGKPLGAEKMRRLIEIVDGPMALDRNQLRDMLAMLAWWRAEIQPGLHEKFKPGDVESESRIQSSESPTLEAGDDPHRESKTERKPHDQNN
jgi:hypothetical protein